MKRLRTGINYIIGLVYIIVVLLIMAVCLLKPQHNLISRQLLIGIILVFFFFLMLYLLLSFMFRKKGNGFCDAVFTVLSILWGIVLICIGVLCRNSTVSFWDYEICYRSALEFARNISLSDAFYFSVNPHNWKCVLVLAFVMKIGYAMGLEDPYYLLLVLNIILIEAALFSSKYILKAFFPYKPGMSLMLIVMFGSCLPLYALSQSFYTDSLSFGFSVIGISLFHYAFIHVGNKYLKSAFLVLSGILVGFGFTMKVTSFICGIAFFLCLLLRIDNKNSNVKYLCAFIRATFGFILICVLLEVISMNYEWYRDKDKFSEPTISYVAMGMKNDGTYYGNRDFRIALDEITDSNEKAEFTKAYICENINELWSIDHILAKMRANYASGNLGAEDFARYSYGDENVLSRLFNYDGDLYWYGCKYDMIWLFQIYLVTAIGATLSFLKKNRSSTVLMGVYELTFLGYFLFLFIWEANNRQLFNMLPMLIIGYVLSLELILGCVVEYIERISFSEKHQGNTVSDDLDGDKQNPCAQGKN